MCRSCTRAGFTFARAEARKSALLLIIAFERHAVRPLDDRFEQLRRAVGGADLSARAAERGNPSETRGAIRSASYRV